MSDQFLDLLARARAGDPAAHDRLARALYAPVRRMLASRFRRQPRDAIDDLTQEAMARIVRLLPTCRARTESRFHAWAYRAARSAALNYLVAPGAVRAAADARLVSLDAPLATSGPADASGTRVADALADAEALAEILWRVNTARTVNAASAGRGGAPPDVRRQRAAVAAYRELPEPAQLLLWLRLVEGAEWADLGRELGTTGAAVKRRFERACARLARQLSDHRGSTPSARDPPSSRPAVRERATPATVNSRAEVRGTRPPVDAGDASVP